MASDTQARVRGILGELQSLDKARELFAELNYDPAHDLLSRKDWSKAAADALAEDPQVIACHDDFKIIYAHLNSDRLLLGDERPVVNRLLQGHPYVLCLFSDIQQQQWHFVNTKYDEDVKKRRLFRRITVGPDERLRTATERLSKLDLERIRADLTGIYPLDIQQRHDEAFDVEVVTKEFYNTFVELFHQLKDEIASNNPTYRDEAPTEAQMLLNRLMFLYFIQKKRWLDNNPAYLYKKFSEYYGRDPRAHSFYSEFLIRLFQQLSNEQVKFDDLGDIPFLNGGLFEIEPFSSQLPFDLKISNRTFRDVFDRLLEHFNFTVREDTPLDVEVAIDPEMLGRVFENLLLQFERERDLRKMTGSYYTPRVIVHFMCQQSLKEYLATESQIDPARLEMLFELNPPDQLEDREVELLKDIVSVPEARTLRDLAKQGFVLDPAVGSGAFLVSMLHEMLTLIKQMDIREHGPEYIARRNYDYELKRNIIENCLYGVDILEQAVRICELRLWLSLVVDYEKELGEEVPSLPNLSYQIKQGDSLIETLFGQRVQLDTFTKTDKGRQLIDELQKEKRAYFLTRDLKLKRQKELSILAKQCELAEILVKEKRQTLGTSERLFGELSAKEAREREEIRQRITSLDKLLLSATNAKQKARAWLERKLPATSTDINRLRQELGISFTWRLDFAEVFKSKNGFDIVIANPPYLAYYSRESKRIDPEYKRQLQKSFGAEIGGSQNSFLQFIVQGLRVAGNRSHICYIVPDTFMINERYRTLRQKLVTEATPVSILQATFPAFLQYVRSCIPLIKNERSTDYVCSVSVADTEKQLSSKQFSRVFERKPEDFLTDPDCRFLPAKSIVPRLDCTVPLSTICKVKDGINPGMAALGLRARLFLNHEGGRNPKKLIEGKNISRYSVRWSGRWVDYDESLITPEAKRGGASLRDEAIFTQAKKLVSRQTSDRLIFASDDEQFYTTNSVHNTFLLPSSPYDLEYILGILNSKFMSYVYRELSGETRDIFPQVHISMLRKLPIRRIDFSNPTEKKMYDDLVDLVHEMLELNRCLAHICNTSSNEQDKLIRKIEQTDAEIDETVYELYELTQEERQAITASLTDNVSTKVMTHVKSKTKNCPNNRDNSLEILQ